MGNLDLFSTIANLLFSAAAAGTVIMVLIFTVTRFMKKDELDGILEKLAVIFAVLWVLDIAVYIYLSIIYKV